MKTFLLTLTIISTLFSSSITQCLSDAEQMALGILGAAAILGTGIYIAHQSQSASSPEPHPEHQTQQNQKSEDKKNPKLIKDLEKPKDHTILPEITQENTPSQKGTSEGSFLSSLIDRIREEETPKHLDALLNDVAFEN